LLLAMSWRFGGLIPNEYGKQEIYNCPYSPGEINAAMKFTFMRVPRFSASLAPLESLHHNG